MAKSKKLPPQFAKQAGSAGKVAKGKMSPVQANKLKHKPDAVLGKNDSAYHNC